MYLWIWVYIYLEIHIYEDIYIHTHATIYSIFFVRLHLDISISSLHLKNLIVVLRNPNISLRKSAFGGD